MRELHAKRVQFSHVRVFRVQFSHVRVFSDSRNVQKWDTNHTPLGHCLLLTWLLLLAEVQGFSSLPVVNA